MLKDLKSKSLLEISQELTRFSIELSGKFRCPTCLRDYSINSAEITEEHIIPGANGGKFTIFLCKECNSAFGSKQTRWLSDWIELNEGGAPFHVNPRKQRATLTTNSSTLSGSLRVGKKGTIEFHSDRNRSNPSDYDAFWSGAKPSEINITTNMPVFGKEHALNVGFLTAAYGLWFKNFGYSFVLQSAMDIVRQQILDPERDLMPWHYLVEVPAREVKNPVVGLMRFGSHFFPIALIYDHLVVLPSAERTHPQSGTADQVSKKLMHFETKISARFQHRCVGPAVLVCDGQEIIYPDLIPNPTIPPQYCRLERWD